MQLREARLNKIILSIVAVIFSASIALAGSSITYEYDYEHDKDKGSTTNSLSLAPAYKFENGIKIDAKLEGSQDSATRKVQNKLEGRIKYDHNLIGPLKGSIRLGIGEKFAQSGNYPYWLIEPGLAAEVTKNIELNTSYRYRNSFNADNDYLTNTWKFGVAYKVDNHEFGVKYFEKYVDTRSNGIETTYTYNFR